MRRRRRGLIWRQRFARAAATCGTRWTIFRPRIAACSTRWTAGHGPGLWQATWAPDMPIKPENLARYPKDWQAIRERILHRAGWRCEHPGCMARQYAVRKVASAHVRRADLL